jgi:aspartate aminotransferase
MLPQEMIQLGTNRSVIRELFEYGKLRAAQVGAENVFDFSIGNPSVPSPACVAQIGQELFQGDPIPLHGYTRPLRRT